MCLSRQGRFRQQVAFVRRQFLQEGQLPFTDILSTYRFSQALETNGVCWNDRILRHERKISNSLNVSTTASARPPARRLGAVRHSLFSAAFWNSASKAWNSGVSRMGSRSGSISRVSRSFQPRSLPWRRHSRAADLYRRTSGFVAGCGLRGEGVAAGCLEIEEFILGRSCDQALGDPCGLGVLAAACQCDHEVDLRHLGLGLGRELLSDLQATAVFGGGTGEVA